jgi:hypothetical protein
MINNVVLLHLVCWPFSLPNGTLPETQSCPFLGQDQAPNSLDQHAAWKKKRRKKIGDGTDKQRHMIVFSVTFFLLGAACRLKKQCFFKGAVLSLFSMFILIVHL